MRRVHLNPAATIISLLGGLTAVAKAAKTSTTSVQRWRCERSVGGTDGYIPRRHHKSLINHARRIGVQLDMVSFLDTSATIKCARRKPRKNT
jgi:UDP-N-acetyl-D-mannosaminuronic acid transferase (WecB/TagA/CpsF family)